MLLGTVPRSGSYRGSETEQLPKDPPFLLVIMGRYQLKLKTKLESSRLGFQLLGMKPGTFNTG